MCFVVFFVFKQKAAYEMRISDWSSDVCSSDLLRQFLPAIAADPLPCPNGLEDDFRNCLRDRQHSGKKRVIDCQRRFGDLLRHAAVKKPTGEQRLLDERQVSSGSIFLPLSDDVFYVSHLLDDSTNLNSQLPGGLGASMPEDDLILPRRIWMRTYQDGCGLPALPDSFLEGLKVISLLTNAISDKGALKEFGIERDNSLPIDHSQDRNRTR